MMLTLPSPKRIVIIGLGGIGSWLSPVLCRMIAFTPSIKEIEVVLVDGDKFEAKNAERQETSGFGSKAEATQAELERRFPFIKFTAINAYIGLEAKFEDDVFVIPSSKIIQEGDWVFGCVDNNRTRLIISKRMQELTNCVFVDGGNELVDGSCQTFVRHEGKNITPPIEMFQPQIVNPDDKAPFEMSCEELAKSGSTQILITNFFTAAMCISSMWRLLEPVEPTDIASVGYFDLAAVLSKAEPVMVYRKYPYTIPTGENKP